NCSRAFFLISSRLNCSSFFSFIICVKVDVFFQTLTQFSLQSPDQVSTLVLRPPYFVPFQSPSAVARFTQRSSPSTLVLRPSYFVPFQSPQHRPGSHYETIPLTFVIRNSSFSQGPRTS